MAGSSEVWTFRLLILFFLPFLVVFRQGVRLKVVQNKRIMKATLSTEHQFAQFIKEQKTTVYTVCYMFSKDEDEVADLFQEVLVNLWKGFESFQGRCNPRTWVYRVSLNTCISAERKRRHRKSVPLTMDISLFADKDEDTRQVQMLRNRILRLGPFDRAIVLLWLEHMSYEEIGQVVGITAKNVSVRLYRIKEQLKQMSDETHE